MERSAINPWAWQDQFGFVQASDLSGVNRVLLCSGQTSVDDECNPVHVGDMAGQINKALDNLETVLGQAGCRPATTLLGIAALFLPELLVEIEATVAQ